MAAIFNAGDLERAVRKDTSKYHNRLMREFKDVNALRQMIDVNSVKSKGDDESVADRRERAAQNWRNRYASHVLNSNDTTTLSDGTIFLPIPVTFGGFLKLIATLPTSERSYTMAREYCAIIMNRIDADEKMDRALALRFNAPEVRTLLTNGRAWRNAVNAKKPDGDKIKTARESFVAVWDSARTRIGALQDSANAPAPVAPVAPVNADSKDSPVAPVARGALTPEEKIARDLMRAAKREEKRQAKIAATVAAQLHKDSPVAPVAPVAPANNKLVA
jgi:hypothetical protein